MARTREFDEEVILQKAVELFWHKGYNATTAQDLVEGLGISRSSLYDTFGDKRNLFIRSLQKYSKEMMQSLNQMNAKTDDANYLIQLIFESALSNSLNNKLAKGCFTINTAIELAPHDSEIAGIVNQCLLDTEDLLFKTIENGQKTGIFNSKENPRKLARFLMNTITGIRVASKSNADKEVLDDIIGVAMSVLEL
jgi:TetR/AcrR family transcriptional regulator, transcriptional repressor for nem operon